jgi:hypothetical protein
VPHPASKRRCSWPAACAALLASAVLLCAATGGQAEEDESETSQDAAVSEAERRAIFLADVCERIESAARKWKLPPAFLARLIWKESRFDPSVVSPKGASGIAQFMAGTARHRGLDDPFDPRSAIPASAHYLFDLRNEFGNLGLAAAAYNAGPNRVRNWRAGRRGLPAETRDFVLSITGFGSHEWNKAEAPQPEFTLHKELSFQEACRTLPIRRMPRQPYIYASSYATAEWQPWRVHLTSDWSPTRALSYYAEIQSRFPAVLAGLAPMVLRVVNYSLGRAPRFEVAIGKPDRAEASAFCKKLRQAGGLCLVLKTPRQ